MPLMKRTQAAVKAVKSGVAVKAVMTSNKGHQCRILAVLQFIFIQSEPIFIVMGKKYVNDNLSLSTMSTLS